MVFTEKTNSRSLRVLSSLRSAHTRDCLMPDAVYTWLTAPPPPLFPIFSHSFHLASYIISPGEQEFTKSLHTLEVMSNVYQTWVCPCLPRLTPVQMWPAQAAWHCTHLTMPHFLMWHLRCLLIMSLTPGDTQTLITDLITACWPLSAVFSAKTHHSLSLARVWHTAPLSCPHSLPTVCP